MPTFVFSLLDFIIFLVKITGCLNRRIGNPGVTPLLLISGPWTLNPPRPPVLDPLLPPTNPRAVLTLQL